HRAPEPAGGQHVGLVHGGELLAALSSQASRDSDHPRDLLRGIGAGIQRPLRAASLFAEVQAAGQLAHENQIHVLQDLGLERGGGDQSRVDRDRAQVGKQAEQSPQIQKPLFRTHRRLRIPLGSPDGADQHRRRAEAEVQGGRRKRSPGAIDGDASDRRLHQLELMAKTKSDRLQNPASLADYLRSDPVTGQHRNQRSHRCSSYREIASACPSRKPSSSTPLRRQWRANGSRWKVARVPSARETVCVSRETTSIAPGDSRRRRWAALAPTTGNSPLITALRRKMSAIEQLTTARKPCSNEAQAACSPEEPEPKFSPATNICAPFASGRLSGNSARSLPASS